MNRERRFSTLLFGATIAALSTTSTADPILTVVDTRQVDGNVSLSTPDWKLVFGEDFNGGIYRWIDLAADPGETDNLTTASGGGSYNTGTLFDYDVYLGFQFNQINEFMTTVGANTSSGALEFEILEDTPVRARIRQAGHPRLNNATGPPGDPFVELPFVAVETIWSIYPTGRVAIEFRADRNPAGEIVDSGPGGAGKGVQRPGPPFDTWLNATGDTDFLSVFATAGDTIESPGGGWGPIHIARRMSSTQLILESPAPTGGPWDYVIRRDEVRLETISIHADGDPAIVNQCSDPAVSRWEGGSNGDPLWTAPGPDSCGSTVPGRGSRPDDVILAHWSKDRDAGSLLAFFEPWVEANAGFFNDTGFTDISYTQLGRAGFWSFEPHHRHFLAHMGSSAPGSSLPSIKSVVDAEPFGLDYREPFAEALVGALDAGPDMAAHGFDPGRGAYRIVAAGNEAVIRLDASGGGRTALAYRAPVVELVDLFATDADLVVERSTDAGQTFSPLPAIDYNVTSQADESELGAGRRVFQLLVDVPASATGPAAWALRFAAAQSGGCPVTPSLSCSQDAKNVTLLLDKEQPGDPHPMTGGGAKLVFKWVKGSAPGGGAVQQTDFGIPGSGAPGGDVSLCIYEDAGPGPTLISSLVAPRTGPWKEMPGKGWSYIDKGSAVSAQGVERVLLKANEANKAVLVVLAKGAEVPVPALPRLPSGYEKGMPLDRTYDVQLHIEGQLACYGMSYGVGTIPEIHVDKLKGNGSSVGVWKIKRTGQ